MSKNMYRNCTVFALGILEAIDLDNTSSVFENYRTSLGSPTHSEIWTTVCAGRENYRTGLGSPSDSKEEKHVKKEFIQYFHACSHRHTNTW